MNTPSSIYPWQEVQWTHIQSMILNNRLPHALLISGSKGTGIENFAVNLAASILCNNPADSGISCQTCPSCHLFLAETHPDLLQVSPEEEGKTIKVEQIRKLVEFTQLQSHYGHKKVIIIHPADAMNSSSSNSLLKTLEEPPGDTLILLVSHKPNMLPVTIRSRCQNIKISASSVHINDWLADKADPEQIETINASGRGPLYLEVELEKEHNVDRKSLLDDLEKMSSGRKDPLETAEQWSRKEAVETLFWLMKIIQDMVKLKSADNYTRNDSTLVKLTNTDLINSLKKQSELFDIQEILNIYDTLLSYNQLLSLNTSLKALTIFEDITIKWTKLSKR